MCLSVGEFLCVCVCEVCIVCLDNAGNKTWYE